MADISRLPGPNADIWDWQLIGLCRGEDPNASIGTRQQKQYAEPAPSSCSAPSTPSQSKSPTGCGVA